MRVEKLEKLEEAGRSIGDTDGFLDDIQSLKLKVGKHYRNRKGDIVSIIKKYDDPNLFPFISKCGKGFNEDGTFLIGGEHNLDLIEELEPLDELTYMLSEYHYRRISERTFRGFVAGFLNAEGDVCFQSL